MSEPATSRQPVVTSIRLEYADGSCDDIKLLQRGICPLFRLSRKRPDSEMHNLGFALQGAWKVLAASLILFDRADRGSRTSADRDSVAAEPVGAR